MKLKILDDKNFLELLKGSSISFVAKVVGMLLGYGCMLFITNIYGASEWGLYSLSITVLSILAIVPKFGLDYSLVRVIAEIKNTQSRKDIIKVIARALVISLFLGLLIISLIELFSAFITDQFLVDEKADLKIYLISYTIIPIVVLTIVGAVYQAFKNPFLYIIFQTALLNFMFLSGLMLNYFFEFNLEIFELYF